jgi:hypothetical protein
MELGGLAGVSEFVRGLRGFIDPLRARRMRDDKRVGIDPSVVPGPCDDHSRVFTQRFRDHRWYKRCDDEGCRKRAEDFGVHGGSP